MKRILLFIGLAMGLGMCLNLVYAVYQCYHNPDFQGNEVWGYTFLLLVFSLLFFGLRHYRNRELQGYMTFWEGCKAGLLMTFVAGTVYVVAWMFSYYLLVPDFMEKYSAHVLREAAREGASPAELAEKTKQMEDFTRWYQNPVLVVLLTYLEVVPVGIVVTLLSALALKKKRPTDQN